ncbi:SBBP repeat-containing protein [Hymenobacter koreensis]|uniref:T9SS type A sorting domain-containing protein n=1 Tax=Hymenobacter koreensis TaxID=1084523 RepID=A0ABP8IXF2_9BACT
MKVDAAGNAYITYTYLGSGRVDYITCKVSAAGTLQWTAEYDGTGNGDDSPAALVVDANGNVYVTGTSKSPFGVDEFATVKYNAAGVQQWVQRYGANGYTCRAEAMTIDAFGNLYIVGMTPSRNDPFTDTFNDFMTLKYSASGVLQWARRGGSTTKGDDPVGIGVDAKGNVYVAGTSVEQTTATVGTWRVETVYLIEKYLPNGFHQWSARHIYPRGGRHHNTRAMAVDAAGNTYVTGTLRLDGGTTPVYYTVKYNSSGSRQWYDYYRAEDDYYSHPNAIAVSSVGNVYVTGRLSLRDLGSYYGTLKYSPTGMLLWGSYHGYGNRNEGLAVAVDASDNAYVTGLTTGSYNSLTDCTTLKYNSDGTKLWAKTFNGYGNGDDRGENVVADGSGNVYISGTTNDGAHYYDAVIIKYAPITSGLKTNLYPTLAQTGIRSTPPSQGNSPSSLSSTTSELMAFPVPFTNGTTIHFGLATDAARARLQVFDGLGRVVATLHDGPLVAGQRYTAQLHGAALAGGLYVCRLTTPTTTQQIRLTRSR